jgi:hypothetical protein
MKKVIALLGLVLATGSVSHAQEQGKISFFECRANVVQKMRLFAGADEKNLLNEMAAKGQCSLATDLSFENAAQALRDPNSQGERLYSVDQLPYEYMRSYCDGEDLACMKANEEGREGEADETEVLLNPAQFQAVSNITADGIAKKIAKKSIYFMADESNKSVDLGEGYDGNWTTFDLKKSALLIK